MKPMIARVWTGRSADADAYADYIRATGFAEYGQTPGNRGAWLLRRDVEGIVEAIRGWGGHRGGGPLPRDRFLIDGESSITHYTVARSAKLHHDRVAEKVAGPRST